MKVTFQGMSGIEPRPSVARPGPHSLSLGLLTDRPCECAGWCFVPVYIVVPRQAYVSPVCRWMWGGLWLQSCLVALLLLPSYHEYLIVCHGDSPPSFVAPFSLFVLNSPGHRRNRKKKHRRHTFRPCFHLICIALSSMSKIDVYPHAFTPSGHLERGRGWACTTFACLPEETRGGTRGDQSRYQRRPGWYQRRPERVPEETRVGTRGDQGG